MDSRRAVIDSESTAGSFHPSVTNSQKRLRISPYFQSTDGHDGVPAPVILQPRDQSFLWVTTFLKHTLAPNPTLPLSKFRHRPWSRLYLKWIMLVYCFLSVIIFSLDLYTHTLIENHKDFRVDAISAFGGVSTSQRLSRISPLQPHLVDFDPFIISANNQLDQMAVTACMWTSELRDFDRLYSWASQWRGPISLLVTTTKPLKSRAQDILFHKLIGLKERPISGLSVHLLRVTVQHQISSNTYLNLARLFALTSTVMLIPGDLSEPPPPSHDTIVSQLFHSNHMPAIISHDAQAWSDLVLSPFSPVVVPRHFPIWCTERFFLHNTRVSDWRACLWQLWLESFGEFLNLGLAANATNQQVTNSYDATQDHLTVRFRAETCGIATKTIATLGVKHYTEGKKKLLWLKQMCTSDSN